MKGWIYKYTFPNGKIYIGQTRQDGGTEKRFYDHIHHNKENITICDRAIEKYGADNVKVETIEEIDVEDKILFQETLNEAEKKWITHYGSTNRGIGYNIQGGGEQMTPLQWKREELFDELYRGECSRIKKKCDKYTDRLWNAFNRIEQKTAVKDDIVMLKREIKKYAPVTPFCSDYHLILEGTTDDYECLIDFLYEDVYDTIVEYCRLQQKEIWYIIDNKYKMEPKPNTRRLKSSR